MAPNTPAATETKAPQGKRLPKLPEERFWKRYSPHHEFPLSFSGSTLLHVLIFGLLVLLFLSLLGFNSNRSLPVDPVRIALGGGGGNKDGVEGGSGPGKGPLENVEQGDPGDKPVDGADVERPALTQTQVDKLKMDFPDPKDVRLIQESEVGRRIAALDKSVRDKLRDGLNGGKGAGGPGKDGGKDGGRGTGTGNGQGEGKAALTQREKRMLRWTMAFDTRNPEDYISQLDSLGAILAIPKQGNPRDYHIVRDLRKRPAELLDEDLSQIQRIYWIDNKRDSAHAVTQALGIPWRPDHFVAFMPQELEERLAAMELKYRGLTEDQIFETRFKAVRRPGGGYDVIVTGQTPKK
jgi:hypothetical protein